MVDDKFDPSPSARRMEIRTGVGERRVFSAKEKGRICRGILFAWRCRFRDCSLNRRLRRSAAILGPKWFTQRSTARLARSLGVALNEAESVRSQREKAKTPDAADLAMRGWAETNRSGLLAYPTVAALPRLRGVRRSKFRLDQDQAAGGCSLRPKFWDQESAPELSLTTLPMTAVVDHCPSARQIPYPRGDRLT
jgi:hypothetical protein